MKKLIVLAVLVVAACGGKNKGADEGGATIDTQATTGDPTDRSGSMVSPETMDEISRLLQRKQMIISRCLSSAVEAGEAPKGTHAKITVGVKIAPSGQVNEVNIIKSTIELKTVQGCVKRHVEEITFPKVPQVYETTHSYSMEAN